MKKEKLIKILVLILVYSFSFSFYFTWDWFHVAYNKGGKFETSTPGIEHVIVTVFPIVNTCAMGCSIFISPYKPEPDKHTNKIKEFYQIK